MFMGAYWPERKEAQKKAAGQLAQFFGQLSQIDPALRNWFAKTTRKSAPKIPLQLDREGIADGMRLNRRDSSNEVIAELGFSFSAWNGEALGIAATLGAYSSYVPNSVVLSCEADATLAPSVWRLILEAAITAFLPEYAAVTSSEILARSGALHPWEAGLLTYRRNSGIQEHDVLARYL